MLFSVIATDWNRNHLLPRALHWLAKMDFPKDNWELVAIDDNSPEPQESLFDPYCSMLNIRTMRLEHSDGWRGITAGMNTAARLARGKYLVFTNSHTLLPPDTLSRYLATQQKYGDCWCTIRAYTLTREATMWMDSVNWREDLDALQQVEGFNCEWTKLWENRLDYMSMPFSCLPREIFTEQIGMFPEMSDYGTEDPWFVNRRKEIGLPSYCLGGRMAYHLSHNNHEMDVMEFCHTELNRQSHSRQTANIWDGGRFDQYTTEDIYNFWCIRNEDTVDRAIKEYWGWPCKTKDWYKNEALGRYVLWLSQPAKI